MLSKDLVKLALILSLCTIIMDCGQPEVIDCESLPGSRPIEIYNSWYWLLNNGSLCCPLNTYNERRDDYCISESRAREECARRGRGIDKDPCLHCDTCTKLIGESCYGPQGTHGFCDKEMGLVCIGMETNKDFIGVCTTKGGPAQRNIGEDCGGRNDSLGICRSGLACQEVQKGRNRVCVMNGM